MSQKCFRLSKRLMNNQQLMKNYFRKKLKKLFMKAKRNLIVRFVQLFSQSNKVQNNTF